MVYTVDAVDTAYTVDHAYIVDTAYTVYDIETAYIIYISMYAYIYCKGRLERNWNGLGSDEQNVSWSGWMTGVEWSGYTP